jgi:fucokinase
VVYFSSVVAGKLLNFYTKPPLDACTYMGVDSGEPPIQVLHSSHPLKRPFIVEKV